MALGIQKLLTKLGPELARKLGLIKVRKLSRYARSVNNPVPILKPTKAGRRANRDL